MGVNVSDVPKIRSLADRLIASCDGGRDQWDEIEALTEDECRLLDTMALECVRCNHWFAASEMNDTAGEYICEDCS